MKKALLLVLFHLIFLFGCTTTERLALDRNIDISSISVSENILIPEDIYYVGKGSAFGLIGGLANMSPANALKKYAIENGIDIKEIVRNTFIDTLKEVNKYPYSENATHQINLEVKVYGVSGKSLFSDDYFPVLLIQAEMIDETKNKIWKNGHYIQPLGNPIAPVPMKKILEDPEVLKKLWSDAARVACQKIIGQL